MGKGAIAEFFVEIYGRLVVGEDLQAQLAIAPLAGPGFGMVDEGGADSLAAMLWVNI